MRQRQLVNGAEVTQGARRPGFTIDAPVRANRIFLGAKLTLQKNNPDRPYAAASIRRAYAIDNHAEICESSAQELEPALAGPFPAHRVGQIWLLSRTT